MRRALAWIGGVLGAAAFARFLRRRTATTRAPSGEPAATDPALELRRRLAEARGTPDDRDDFDAAEGVPLDQADPAARPADVDERRRAVHERGQAALEEMRPPADDPRE